MPLETQFPLYQSQVASDTAECLVFGQADFKRLVAQYFEMHLDSGNVLNRAGKSDPDEDADVMENEKKQRDAKELRRNVRLSVNMRASRNVKRELSELQEVRTLCNGTFGKITIVQGQKVRTELCAPPICS